MDIIYGYNPWEPMGGVPWAQGGGVPWVPWGRGFNRGRTGGGPGRKRGILQTGSVHLAVAVVVGRWWVDAWVGEVWGGGVAEKLKIIKACFVHLSVA